MAFGNLPTSDNRSHRGAHSTGPLNIWSILAGMPLLEELSLSCDHIQPWDEFDNALTNKTVKVLKLDLRIRPRLWQRLLRVFKSVEIVHINVSGKGRVLDMDTIIWPESMKELLICATPGLCLYPRFYGLLRNLVPTAPRNQSLAAIRQNIEFLFDDTRGVPMRWFNFALGLPKTVKDLYLGIGCQQDWVNLASALRSVESLDHLYLFLRASQSSQPVSISPRDFPPITARIERLSVNLNVSSYSSAKNILATFENVGCYSLYAVQKRHPQEGEEVRQD